MGTFATEIFIEAPVQEVWKTLSEIGDIQLWNPGVVASQKTSEDQIGLGSSRYCDLGNGNFLDEEVVTWQPNEKLTMRITDTNLPFESADIRFALQEADGGTIVEVSPNYKIKFGILGKLLDRVTVQRTYEQGMNNLLAGLKKHIESGPNSSNH